MLWPKKRKQIPEEEASILVSPEGGASILTILPRELVIYMMQFLSVYQQVGLGRVSKYFRSLLTSHFGYDPFAPAEEHWTRLGMVSRAGHLSSRDVEALQQMAGEAYGYIYRNLHSIGKVGQGVCCSTLVKLSTESAAPTGRSFIKANCLAELQVGGRTVRAVNFIDYADQEAAEKLMASLGVDVTAVRYQLVKRRHAEMRLIMKLTDDPASGSAELRIDKLCCVFCAAQLAALGYKHLIAGWAAGNLQWYTFSPITMFFTNRRAAIWGPIEQRFAGLSPDQKIEFLHLLAQQADRSSTPGPVISPTPQTGVRQIAVNDSGVSGPTVAHGQRHGLPPQPPPVLSPACPKCQGPMTLRTNSWNGQRFWGCRRYPTCKGTQSA